MSKAGLFYKSGGFAGKEGPYSCLILGRFWIFTVIRYSTLWDELFINWSTRIKFSWNVEELS